jgi:CheY-like chemotaxis protein
MLVLHDRLRDEGFRIFQAANGQEALDLALKEHPDLIMLDLLMPVMDGVTMLKELRKDEWGKEVKVLVLTNLSTDEKLDEVKEFGVEDYLVKSDWKIEDVVQKIKNLMP